ncbi:MAG: patatin family protein [Clostridia bacterium]|nr:patatin family protein [Clostridia bacterium]
MKTGLVLEGGALRGLFTAGILDVMMENGVMLDAVVGVSAGAVFGCNFKSRQIGRTIRYNQKYRRNWRFGSFRSLLMTGDYYGADFCYRRIPEELDVFDAKTFRQTEMTFDIVCTDVETGEAVYHRCTDAMGEDLKWMRASASMPLASTPVEIGGRKYLDGGIADSIPLHYMEKLGFAHCIVILTQPLGFVKTPNKLLPLIRKVMKKYPRLIEALEMRHEKYNAVTKEMEEKEKNGQILVIRPKERLRIGATCRDPKEMQRVYELGCEAGKEYMERIKAFVGN